MKICSNFIDGEIEDKAYEVKDKIKYIYKNKIIITNNVGVLFIYRCICVQLKHTRKYK